MKFPQIYCNDISYRSGFVEVLPNIHRGHINLEVWNLHPDFRHSEADASIADASIRDEAVTANTEIELNISQARRLIELLSVAIEAAEQNSQASTGRESA